MAAWYESLAAFDLETTGIDVSRSRIVTACLARIDAEGNVTERRDWLVDPGVEIPERATQVHGITTERARAEGRPAGEAVPEIAAAVQAVLDAGIGLVVYNAPYDLSLLSYEAARHGVAANQSPRPVVDPIVLDKQVDRYRRGKRTLVITAEHYGVPLDDAHDAGADAIAAGRVAQAIGRRYAAQLPAGVEELHDAQIGWGRAQQEDFAAYMRKAGRDFVADRQAWPGGMLLN